MTTLRKYLAILFIMPAFVQPLQSTWGLESYVDDFMTATSRWGALAGGVVGCTIAGCTDYSLNLPQFGLASLLTGAGTTALVYNYRDKSDLGKQFASKSGATLTAICASGLTIGAILVFAGRLKISQ